MFNYLETKLYLIISWAVAVLILIISPLPISRQESQIFTMHDKIVHFFMFGILAFLIGLAFKKYRKRLGLVLDFLIFASISAYALLAEYIQGFIPSRTPSLWDFIFGVIGVIVGIVIASNRSEKIN